MKKFIALYMMPSAAMEEMKKTMTPEMKTQQNTSWMQWMEARKSSIADMGAPLGKNMRVSASGIESVGNDVGGYTIVQAESQEEAAKMFADNPSMQMPGSFVEVMELMPMSM